MMHGQTKIKFTYCGSTKTITKQRYSSGFYPFTCELSDPTFVLALNFRRLSGVLLPPGDNPIAVNKYIYLNITVFGVPSWTHVLEWAHIHFGWKGYVMRVVQLVETLHYKPECPGFDS